MAWNIEHGALVPSIHPTFMALLEAFPSDAVVGIDIPIGLSEGERRQCDSEARKVLRHRHSCVFDAPNRRILNAESYQVALTLSRSLTDEGITCQSFAIFSRIAEVDSVMTPDLQARVFEMHPEVSFWALAGAPMSTPKRKRAGYDERRGHLERALERQIWTREEARHLAKPAKPDDILDATVAAWTARRIAEGVNGRLPANPQLDDRGLRMEINF
jgi:predicted RNase H-like nuclease